MYRRSTYVGSGRFTAARIITGLGAVFALIEVIYLLMVVLKANASNGAFIFFRDLAEPLALFFPGLFTFANANLSVIVNYGLAAAFWLLVTSLIARVVA